MRKLRHLLYLILLVILDQAVKIAVQTGLAKGKEIVLIPDVLKLIYHQNDGAVWGIMSGQIVLLIVSTCCILAFMVWIYFRIPQTKKYVPLQLIIVFVGAGAIGNLIDRIMYGSVTDFIYFELIDFPVFNIADCYITVSAFLLVILSLFYYKEDELDCIISRKKKEKK